MSAKKASIDQMTPMARFASLTWIDLKDWAGSKIVSRGQSYQRSNAVENLGITPSGRLVAWVRGSHRYATSVQFKGEHLSSSCSCPFGMSCKHAVAVVLAYLEALKRKMPIAPAGNDDNRFKIISTGQDIPDEDEFNDEFYNSDDDDDSDDGMGHAPSRKARRSDAKEKDLLKGKSKSELNAMLKEILERHPDLKKELQYKTVILSGRIGTAVQAVIREIDNVSIEPGWSNHWRNEGYVPDYSKVVHGLQRLLDAGHADAVVKLGERIYRKGTEQIGASNDEGETMAEVASAMSVVFKALRASSLPDVEKVMRMMDMETADEYGLCGEENPFWNKRFSKKTMSEVADRLLARLKEIPRAAKGGEFDGRYRRDRLVRQIVDILDRAGRSREVVPLLEKEIVDADGYDCLARRLLMEERLTEAETWVRKGIALDEKSNRWNDDYSLRNLLLQIKTEDGDWPSVAAMKAESFFAGPDLRSFQDLKTAAAKIRVWDAVRTASLAYLETGDRLAPWPLPDCGLPQKRSNRLPGKPPFLVPLIEIAICEKRIEDVVRWYDLHLERSRGKQAGYWDGNIDNEVADAIVKTHPDRSIDIWKRLARIHTEQTGRSAYETAAGYLQKVRRVMETAGKKDEWKAYVGAMKEEYRRKPRLVETLDGLMGNPIVGKSIYGGGRAKVVDEELPF